jgi:hypothetical protein
MASQCMHSKKVWIRRTKITETKMELLLTNILQGEYTYKIYERTSKPKQPFKVIAED